MRLKKKLKKNLKLIYQIYNPGLEIRIKKSNIKKKIKKKTLKKNLFKRTVLCEEKTLNSPHHLVYVNA
jgi:translation elongation factor EF-G